MAHIEVNSVEFGEDYVLIEGTDQDSVWNWKQRDEQLEAKTVYFLFDLTKQGANNYLKAVCMNNKLCAKEMTTQGKIMALNGQFLTLNDNFRCKAPKAKSK